MLNNFAGRHPPRRGRGELDRWGKLRAIGFSALIAVVVSVVLLIDFLPSNQVILNTGDVSPEDILAPTDLTYQSAIRTKQAQDAAAAAIPDIYDRPDASGRS